MQYKMKYMSIIVDKKLKYIESSIVVDIFSKNVILSTIIDKISWI